MKKTFVFLTLLLSLIVISGNQEIAAQNTFKGTMTYSLSYEGKIEPAMQASLPKEIEIKVYDNKSKTEITQGPTVITTIMDGDKKVMIILMDIAMLGKKIMITTNQEEINKELAKTPSTVNLLNETKSIAGYKCKKGELITKDDDGKETKSVFYYTEELGVGDKNFSSIFKDVKGTLMEYEQLTGEFTTKYVVTNVKKGKVSEKDFLVPVGYEEMTKEQLMEMFGGQ